jgi:hypothetical protein
MVRRLLVTGLAALMTAGALASTAAAQDATGQGPRIIPGQRIASYSLGQDVSSILSSLGPVRSQDDLPETALTGYYWPLKRIGIIADNSSGKVVGLVVSLDDGYTTDKGVGAGTEMDAVRTAYGGEDILDNHDEDETLVYNTLGVAFVVDKNGALNSRVSVIFVFSPGHYRDIFKEQRQNPAP